MNDTELSLGHPAKNDSKQRRKKTNQQRLSLHSQQHNQYWKHSHAVTAVSFNGWNKTLG